MSISISTSSATSPLYDQSSGQTAGIEVLKKAQQIQAENTATLVNSISQPEKSSVNLPDNLGKNINTTA